MSIEIIISMDNKLNNVSFLRYPGGKQRHLYFFNELLPKSKSIKGNYVEPFVGGGSVFFYMNPNGAILSDKNLELIDLYKGIKEFPDEVWQYYCSFPTTKKAYYQIRDFPTQNIPLSLRAARTLYLNRTCFKGMWRHNSQGKFNVGYGGQDRRWVITQEDLKEISSRLSNVVLKCYDFEKIINSCNRGDFLFLDPPYRPGEKEQIYSHYVSGKFTFNDQKRLARSLRKASNKGVKWLMTNSSNDEIKRMYDGYSCIPLQRGTSGTPGIMTSNPGEIIIHNLTEG